MPRGSWDGAPRTGRRRRGAGSGPRHAGGPEHRARARDGRLVWLQHHAHVVRDDDGAARAVHAVLIDVADQKLGERTATLLAAVGERLGPPPGGMVERLTAVAGLQVGTLCDRAAVWLREYDGRYRTRRRGTRGVRRAPAEPDPRPLEATAAAGDDVRVVLPGEGRSGGCWTSPG